eukprot:TRINITY_DN23821_c0_g1_i1.p1 TRINITY_DN23821_c0_g1~~TRINITY_DN23821_c0_g1_i1.p1  ORF type:complete len:1565 (+),score=220.37 TRINITY_DN23821_c0_g1_i1:368-4696(+)
MTSMLTSVIALLIPFWLQVESDTVSSKQTGVTHEYIGVLSVYRGGYSQRWHDVVRACHDAPEKLKALEDAPVERREAVSTRCELDQRLANLGWLTYAGNLLMLFVQAWGCATAVGSRQWAAVLLLAFAIIFHGVLSVFYVTQVHNIVPTKQVASSYWFDVVGFLLQVLSLLLMLVVRIRTEQTSRLLGLDFHFLENAMMLGKVEDSRYSWDETDPGAGCPVFWRTYGYTPAGLYENYKDRPYGVLTATLLYMASLPSHFLKTFDWNGVRLNWYGPDSEVECIRKQGVSTSVVIHYMMYRRSTIICTVLFMFLLLYWRLHDLLAAMEVVHGDAAQTAMLKSFEDYQRDHVLGRDASFAEYSQDAFFQAVAAVDLQSAGLSIWKSLIRVFFLLVALIYSCGAMVQWSKFRTSQYCLIVAWVSILAHPILITCVPSSMLLDWTVFDGIVHNYLSQARQHLQIDELVTGCFLQEPVELLNMSRKYIEQVCPIVKNRFPYVMPSSFKLGPLWVKTEWIPYMTSYYPPGTSLKGLHNFCQTATSVATSGTSKYSAEIIRDGCTTVASFLQRNADPEVTTLLGKLEDLAHQNVEVDTETLQAVHTLQFQQDDVDVDGGLPIVMSLRFYRAAHNDASSMRGTLKYSQDNPEGCRAYRDHEFQDSILVLGPLTKLGCSLQTKLEHAMNAAVAGLILIDPDGLVKAKKDVPDDPDLPVAIVSSRMQGNELTDYLKRHEKGIKGSVEHQHFDWEERHSRTSHGCHCKGRGFYSDCRVREAGILDESQKDAESYPWCETAPLDHMGQPCPVAFDLCVPTGQTGASQSPSGKCLSGCGRRSADAIRDTCKSETSGWIGLISSGKEVNCIPAQGLNGSLVRPGRPVEEVHGSLVNFEGPMEVLHLSGEILTLTRWFSCQFRLVVQGASSRSLKIGPMSSIDENSIAIEDSWYSEVAETWEQTWPEMAIEIKVSAAKNQSFKSARLEQKCKSDTGPTRPWETVRLEQLRHQESNSGLARRLLAPTRPISLRQSTVLTTSDIFHHHPQAMLSATSYRDSPRHAMDGPLSTCSSFVGDICISSALRERCAENQVCNASTDGSSNAYCSCAVGYCWSTIRNGCVEQAVHAQEVVSKLFNDSVLDHHTPRVWETVKGTATVAVTMKESGENLWTVLRHVLAIGPGLLISAWTAKVIFVRSTIPGYFSYFFPWMYSPIAWSLYNVAHQSLADPRLSAAFAILSFWTIPVALVAMKYGLHKPLSVARAMSLSNNLLFFYYFMLLAAVLLIVWFVLAWDPEGNDYVSERLRDDWNPRKLVKDAILSQDLSSVWENLAIYFLTCGAACDVLIAMIVKEHEQAWLLLRKSACSEEDPQHRAPLISKTQHEGSCLALEEQVTRDWLLLLNDKQHSKNFSKAAARAGCVEVARADWDGCCQRRQEDSESADSVPAVELSEISRSSKTS